MLSRFFVRWAHPSKCCYLPQPFLSGRLGATMTTQRKLAVAWALVPMPVVLFFPAFELGSRGPLAGTYPLVIVTANLLFALLECTAFWLFVSKRPLNIDCVVGCILSFGMAVVSVFAAWLHLNSRM